MEGRLTGWEGLVFWGDTLGYKVLTLACLPKLPTIALSSEKSCVLKSTAQMSVLQILIYQHISYRCVVSRGIGVLRFYTKKVQNVNGV